MSPSQLQASKAETKPVAGAVREASTEPTTTDVQCAPAGMPLFIQSDHDTSVPPVPSYQLASSLLEPLPRSSGVRRAPESRLRLSPKVRMLMLDSVRSLLAPRVLADAIRLIDFSALRQSAPAAPALDSWLHRDFLGRTSPA
jgi:hypothetical protein